MVAIFTYNLPVSIQKFNAADCTLITLSDYDVLIEKALKTGYVNEEDLKVLNDFKNAF